MTHGWQSEPTDGSKGGWGSESLSPCLSLFSAFRVSLTICLSLSHSFSIHVSICLSIYLIYLSNLSIYLSFYLFVLSIYQSIDRSIYLFITMKLCETSSIVCKKERQKRSSSARFPSTMESWANAFRNFSSPKYCACDANWGQVIRSAAAVTQNHLSKPDDLMLQNATPLGKSLPDLRTCLIHMSPVLRLPRDMHVFRSSSNAPLCHHRFWTAAKPSRFCHFWQGAESLVPARQNDSRTSKSGPTLRHNGVRLFNISTPKSVPKLRCLVHVYFQMCFAPQRRALFQHLNFQKCSDAPVFCTCLLPKVFRATTACAFLTSQLPEVLRRWAGFDILTSRCASHHSGVHFLNILTPKSAPKL